MKTMALRRLLAVLLAVAAASAAGALAFVFLGGGGTADDGSRVPARADGTAAVDEQAGFLVVDEQLTVIFSEGALPYIRLESAQGRVVAERLPRDARLVLPLLRLQLEPGAYRLVSYLRPCAGGCPRRGVRGLDRPTMRCEATLEIAAGKTVTALIRSGGGRQCRVVRGERVGGAVARQLAFEACRQTVSDRHSLRYWARNWGAASTRPHDLGAAYAEMMFRGFEVWIRDAAADGCTEGVNTVRHPIRFRLDDTYTVGQKIDVAIANVGTRPYLYEFEYQACFLSYFDSAGRRLIIPPGTHCDIRGKEMIRPGEAKRLFSWRLDECVKDLWGCIRSRPLPPGTYTIQGRFKPRDGGTPVRAETTFEIVAA
jgi:hypothetical protein